MHDIRAIRDNPAAFDKGLTSRGLEPLSSQLIALDDARKAAISAAQEPRRSATPCRRRSARPRRRRTRPAPKS